MKLILDMSGRDSLTLGKSVAVTVFFFFLNDDKSVFGTVLLLTSG